MADSVMQIFSKPSSGIPTGCTVQTTVKTGREKKEGPRSTFKFHCGPDREVFQLVDRGTKNQ